jgi:hypothetical protein
MKKYYSILFCLFLFSTSLFAQNTVTCTEKNVKAKGQIEPTIIRTCTWGKYRSVSIGESDYKGRYFYTNSISKLVNGKFVKIENAQFFNENRNGLLKLINQKIKKDFDQYFNDPENKDCFFGIEGYTYNQFEDLKISFSKSGIDISVSFGLSGACLALDGTIVSFTFSELNGYLNN